MNQSLARRLTFRLSIVMATVFALFLAAVPAQAVEYLAKPRYRGRSGGAFLPVWLIILIAVVAILSGFLAKRRNAAKTS